MLNAQDVTRKHIQDALSDGIDAAAAQLAAKRKAERERKAALLSLLLALSPALVAKVQAGIVRGRQAARASAAKRVVAELTAAGIVLGPQGITANRPLLAAAQMNRAADDAIHARAAAESLVTQWRGLAVHASRVAERDGEDDVAAIVRTKAIMVPRVERTANTETAVAYNEEHGEVVREMARYDDAFERELADADVMREWSAMADACENCWPRDGEQIGINDSWSGPDPGEMHIGCRCIEFYISAREARMSA